MYHYRKNYKTYKAIPKSDCAFCEDNMPGRSIETTEYAYVVHNIVPYDVWEMRDVTDHLMVVPKQHVRGLGELTEAAQLDILQVIARYEKDGYNFYGRGISSSQRSVTHQHTHLIKTKPERARLMVSLQKPYILWKQQ